MLLVAESVSAAPPQQADSGGETDTHLEASVDRVIDGDLDPFIRSYLMAKKTKGKLTVEPDEDAA